MAQLHVAEEVMLSQDEEKSLEISRQEGMLNSIVSFYSLLSHQYHPLYLFICIYISFYRHISCNKSLFSIQMHYFYIFCI